jgi:hypothetical protein
MITLDNPAWHALSGPQRALGISTGLAARFHRSICPFAGFAGYPSPSHWADMASLLEPGGTTVMLNLPSAAVPQQWTVLRAIEAIQMLGDTLNEGRGEPWASGEVVPLGDDDVDDMLVLVAEARPGPFLARTIEFGGYLGVRRSSELVAMASQTRAVRRDQCCGHPRRPPPAGAR